VGGGVTWDSTALAEYHEALDKAAVLLEPAAEFELLETLLLKNGSFVLLERHLERLVSQRAILAMRSPFRRHEKS
jgi:para-aminobenzoate synthetase/4-amino-4-deoxychorismate lyase